MRTPKRDPNSLTVTWDISIPRPLAIAIENKLHDPIYGKPQYGARAKLIVHLLTHWLRENSEIPDMDKLDKAGETRADVPPERDRLI